MKTLPHACLSCLLFSLTLAALMWPEEGPGSKVLHLKEAEFRQSLGQVLFSQDGSLYVAYRLRERNQRSTILRVIKFDPITGETKATGDFPLPQVRLPRAATNFILSSDSSLLAYAELHSPQVLLTMDAATLKPISISRAALFSRYDLAVHIKDFSSQSLVLSAERPRRRRPITIESVHEIALNPSNLSQVISEKKMSVADSPSDLQTWMKMSREDLSLVVPLEDGALGFSDWKTRGGITLFDSAGKGLAALPLRDCGVTQAAVTSDRQFALAVCERPVQNEQHRQTGCLRKAILFAVNTLRVLRNLPMSGLTLKEQTGDAEDPWSASPSPAIWRGKDEILVAIPDSSSTIKLYTFSLTTDKTSGQ